MLEQIAVLKDEHGKLASLSNVEKISIYERTNVLIPVKELSVSKSLNTTQGFREFAECLSQELGECKILLGSLMTGIFFQTMTKKGFTLLEAESYDEELLEVIYTDLKKNKSKQEEVLPDVSNKPEPVDHDGNYFLDLYQLQKRYPEISSKKAMLSFLSHELFLSLTIRCSHVMPWLDPYCEEHNLTYREQREDGLSKVIITHKVCTLKEKPREVLVTERKELLTPYGTLIPKYQRIEARDKYRNSLSYYENGDLKSIYLEERVNISTLIGSITAEFLTFYEGGEIHRIFPRYGQLSGFWSEENEYELEPLVRLALEPGTLENKFTSYVFYKTGELAAATIVSTERFVMGTSVGKLHGRYGFSLYPSGKLKSMEPAFPTKISTCFGMATVYDTQALGIHADKNSLEFDEEGRLTGMAVVAESLWVENGTKRNMFSPMRIASQIDPEQQEILPIHIYFTPESIVIKDGTKQEHRFEREGYQFSFQPLSDYCSSLVMGRCSSCSGCSGCKT